MGIIGQGGDFPIWPLVFCQ